MKLHELSGVDAAADATGHVVIIDVLRAFTCTAYALAGGAAEVLLAGSIAEALELKRQRPRSLLVGHGTREQASLFDVGNSPLALTRMDLCGRTLIQRTGSGTQGVVAASRADAVYVAALVNAAATSRHLLAIGADVVSLVAMGAPTGGLDGPEDLSCRDLLAVDLQRNWISRPFKLHEARRVVRTCPAALQLLDVSGGIGCPADVELAAAIDRFPFAIEVRNEGGVRSATPWVVHLDGPQRGFASPFQKPSIDAWLTHYRSANQFVRRRAIEAMLRRPSEVPASTWLEILERLFNQRLGGPVMRVLRTRFEPEIYEAMLRLLGSPEPFLREAACDYLGTLGDRRATISVLPLLDDPDLMTRRKAAFALAFIQDPIAKPELLRQYAARANDDINVRVGLSAALEALGVPHVKP